MVRGNSPFIPFQEDATQTSDPSPEGTDISGMHSIDFSGIQHLVIDKNLIYSWIESFKRNFIFIIYPCVLLFSFLCYSVQILLCAWLGKFFARMFDLEMPFRALVRLSVVAFTPPLVLQTVHSLLNIEFPYSGVISLFFATCYLYFGVSSVKEPLSG
jgi:hypothetical protein